MKGCPFFCSVFEGRLAAGSENPGRLRVWLQGHLFPGPGMVGGRRTYNGDVTSPSESGMEDQVKKQGPGKVYLVGAGPGDPGLITVRGKQLLERAEVVIYDYLASPRLLRHIPKDAELVYAGKKGGVQHTHTQEEINQMLVDFARQGKMVVRLKGGDPFIFGRGGEELQQLAAAGVPFEVVPGVTSASAAATYAGIPITHRDYTASVAFITGHEDPTKENSNVDWARLATGAGTLVIYMGIKNLPIIVDHLISNGRNPKTPVAVVRWASTPEQQSVVATLDTIVEVVRENGIKPPSLVIVGEVVKLRDTIDWFEKRPLFGKRIIVTRTREQASDLVAGLEEAGADCLEYSTINIQPADSYEILDSELERLDEYHWIVFTSLNGVDYFFQRLYARGMDARNLKGPGIAVVGKSTAELLLKYGVNIALAIKLFDEEAVSLGTAARLAEMSLSSFIDLLGRMHIPIARYESGEIEKELDRKASASTPGRNSRSTVVVPSAASPARMSDALARRSVAITGAPLSLATPVIIPLSCSTRALKSRLPMAHCLAGRTAVRWMPSWSRITAIPAIGA